MSDSSTAIFADLLAEAWRSGKPMSLPAQELRPTNRRDALDIQDLVAARIGESIAGWKIGATSPAVQKKQGLDGPIPGRIFAPGIYFSPASVPANRCPSATLECEIAFRLTADLPRRSRPYDTSEIDPIAVLHFAVEVTGSRYASFNSLHPPSVYDLIADNGGGAAFVFGRSIADWQSIDFANLPVELSVAGGSLAQNFMGEFRRNPSDIMAETIAHAHDRGANLSAGEFISTGSLVVPQPIAVGQSAVVRFGDYDEIRVTLV